MKKTFILLLKEARPGSDAENMYIPAGYEFIHHHLLFERIEEAGP